MVAKEVTPILNVSDIQESFARGECEIFLCQDGQGGRGKSSLTTTTGFGEGTDKGAWMSIWVDNVDAVHRRCLEQGLEVTWPPIDDPWSVREMHGRHPDGPVFRISQRLEEDA